MHIDPLALLVALAYTFAMHALMSRLMRDD